MVTQIQLGEIAVEVVQKNIKNIHLSVHPPAGAVRIAAPLRMDLDTIRVFAISKLAWIKQQQQKLRAQERETPREYLDRESHYCWGQRYLLKMQEHDAPPSVELRHKTLVLKVRPGTTQEKKQVLLDEWYRQQLKDVLPPLLAKWEKRMKVQAARVTIRKMKTKWGTCTPAARTIRLNLELAKKPPLCLEYILVHELAHLIERTHNQRFTSLLDKFLPNWRHLRDELNRLPVKHEKWGY